MKVLQTIGHIAGFPQTPFFYRRDSAGVRIESIVGKSIRFSVDSAVWQILLAELAQHSGVTLGISSQINANIPSVHQIIQDVTGTSNDRAKAYVTAVLLHEGSIILHHGPEGDGQQHRIPVRVSLQTDVHFARSHPDIP